MEKYYLNQPKLVVKDEILKKEFGRFENHILKYPVKLSDFNVH